MSRRVSISMRAALNIKRAVNLGCNPDDWAMAELRRAMEPKRRAAARFLGDNGPAKGTATAARHHRDARRAEMAAIWEACWARCGGVCECGCGRPCVRPGSIAGDLNIKAELEHPFSKGRGARLPQSVETCWILRADCHRDRHAARPDAATWWKKFLVHVMRQVAASSGDEARRWAKVANVAGARLRFVETRASLPAAPRTGGRDA